MSLRNEYTDEAIYEEHRRRTHCKSLHECSHCGGRLDSKHGCIGHNHNTPMPGHVATEASLQGIAATLSHMLPSGRGFTLTVIHTAEGCGDGSFGSYVSNLPPAQVPEHLRETALYIEQREQRKEPK